MNGLRFNKNEIPKDLLDCFEEIEAACGSPWKRVFDSTLVPTAKASFNSQIDERDLTADVNDQGSNRMKDGHKPGWINSITTTGWRPDCDHYPRFGEWVEYLIYKDKTNPTADELAEDARRAVIRAELLEFWKDMATVPCVVLDPFTGSGTSGLVSLKHRRRFIGIELNPEYIKIAEKRLRDVQVKLF